MRIRALILCLAFVLFSVMPSLPGAHAWDENQPEAGDTDSPMDEDWDAIENRQIEDDTGDIESDDIPGLMQGDMDMDIEKDMQEDLSDEADVDRDS